MTAAERYIDTALAATDFFASSTAVRYGARLAEVDRNDEALPYLAVASERGDSQIREQAEFLKALVLAGQGASSAYEAFIASSRASDPAVSLSAREYLGQALELLLSREAPGTAAMGEDMPEELRRVLHEHYADLVSRQPPPDVGRLAYVLLTQLAVEIEGAIEELGIQLPVRPWLATIATGDVNAHAWMETEPDGAQQPVVACDSGTYTFLHLTAKAVTTAMWLLREKGTVGEDSGYVSTHVEQLAPAIDRFCEATEAYLVEGDPRAAPVRPADAPIATAAIDLTHNMERFLLAHEYGHLLAGHAASDHETAWTLQEELEADAWGLKLSHRAATAEGPVDPYPYLGAVAALQCLRLGEVFADRLTAPRRSTTHQSPIAS